MYSSYDLTQNIWDSAVFTDDIPCINNSTCLSGFEDRDWVSGRLSNRFELMQGEPHECLDAVADWSNVSGISYDINYKTCWYSTASTLSIDSNVNFMTLDVRSIEDIEANDQEAIDPTKISLETYINNKNMVAGVEQCTEASPCICERPYTWISGYCPVVNFDPRESLDKYYNQSTEKYNKDGDLGVDISESECKPTFSPAICSYTNEGSPVTLQKTKEECEAIDWVDQGCLGAPGLTRQQCAAIEWQCPTHCYEKLGQCGLDNDFQCNEFDGKCWPNNAQRLVQAKSILSSGWRYYAEQDFTVPQSYPVCKTDTATDEPCMCGDLYKVLVDVCQPGEYCYHSMATCYEEDTVKECPKNVYSNAEECLCGLRKREEFKKYEMNLYVEENNLSGNSADITLDRYSRVSCSRGQFCKPRDYGNSLVPNAECLDDMAPICPPYPLPVEVTFCQCGRNIAQRGQYCYDGEVRTELFPPCEREKGWQRAKDCSCFSSIEFDSDHSTYQWIVEGMALTPLTYSMNNKYFLGHSYVGEYKCAFKNGAKSSYYTTPQKTQLLIMMS